MIVIDTSALMAILQDEPGASDCRSAIAKQDQMLIAAPNLTEALIVAAHRQLHDDMTQLIDDLELIVMSLTEPLAYAAVRAYRHWGKGSHPAGLNFGDCFAYALAKEHDCPLLFVGDDFAKTDVKAATG